MNTFDREIPGADIGGAPGARLSRLELQQTTPTGAPGLNRKEFIASLQESGAADAKWLRLPKPGARCAICGLSRTTMVEAISRGDLRSVEIRQPGASRGIRLICKESLLAWLQRLDREQNGAVKTVEGA